MKGKLEFGAEIDARMLLPSPKSDGALFIFPALTGLRIFAYVAGKRVAVSRGTQ
jgi:hypothetical protein